MTTDLDPAEPIVGFQRHPASIELHQAPGRAASPNHAFACITTWSPTTIPEYEDEPEPPAPIPEPAPVMASAPQPLVARFPVPPPSLPPAPDPVPDPVPEHVSLAPVQATAPDPRDDLLWPGIPSPNYAGAPPRTSQLWDVELADPEVTPVRRPPWAAVRVAAMVAGAVLAVCLAVFIGVRLLPSWLNHGREDAVFNAPMMVVRAAVTGRVATVAVSAGQMVDPQSPLLTIRTADPANPDRRVLAGVHGMIRSVETVPGADLSTGSPLVRLHDCDRAFLTVAPDTKLAAGAAVQVKLPDLPAIPGTVRRSSGIMEPPDSLVVGLAPGVLANACPVGAGASITPAPVG